MFFKQTPVRFLEKLIGLACERATCGVLKTTSVSAPYTFQSCISVTYTQAFFLQAETKIDTTVWAMRATAVPLVRGDKIETGFFTIWIPLVSNNWHRVNEPHVQLVTVHDLAACLARDRANVLLLEGTESRTYLTSKCQLCPLQGPSRIKGWRQCEAILLVICFFLFTCSSLILPSWC